MEAANEKLHLTLRVNPGIDMIGILYNVRNACYFATVLEYMQFANRSVATSTILLHTHIRA